MSPISAEMNGNVSNQALNSSTNSNSNISNPNKSLLEDSNSGGSEVDGGFSGSSYSSAAADSGRPLTTSTPIDQSFDGTEQPTSSTESNSNFGFSAPKFGTLIPNRVFVGGISCHTTESELMQLFSKFGAVRGTKIIMDRAGVSKGYGFVTFETEEEAKRLFNAMNNREMPPIIHRERRLNIAPAVKKQPMLRQNTPYAQSNCGNGVNSAFSPPPFDSYYYTNQQQQQENFFGTPVPMQDNYFGQSNGFPPATPVQSSGSMQPFYTTIPTLGQAISGPNGGVFFLPMNTLPYQQTVGGSDQWNGSSTAYNSNLNSYAQSQWRFMNPAMTAAAAGLPNLTHPGGNSFHGCNSHTSTGGMQSISTPSIGSPQHQYIQDHLLGHHGSTQDPLYYFSSALISSPH